MEKIELVFDDALQEEIVKLLDAYGCRGCYTVSGKILRMVDEKYAALSAKESGQLPTTVQATAQN